MFGHLMTRAREFAQVRWLAGETGIGTDGVAAGSADELADRYQQGIAASFERYLGLFADDTVERAGFGLGVARLLQYLLGLESIKDASIFPLDRTSFGVDAAKETFATAFA
jgi:hypothetical protein